MNDTAELVRQRELSYITQSIKEIKEFLDADSVTDIWCDGRGVISIKEFGGLRKDTDKVLSMSAVRSIILQIAKFTEIPIDYNLFPGFEGTIPIYNARITGLLPPLTATPEFTIRKPPKLIFPLEDYLEKGRLTKKNYTTICNAIKNHKNILISGATNSGKTTFANAILAKLYELYPERTLYIIEDNAELQSKSNYATFVKVKRTSGQPLMALEFALRWSINHVIFGEVRDGAVLNILLEAWKTGHSGFCTIHAENCEVTLLRIRGLLGQVYQGELPEYTKIINLIVHLRSDEKKGVIIDEVMDTSKISESYIEHMYKEEFLK